MNDWAPYVIASVFGTGFLSWVAWTAKTLLRHAEVMSAIQAEQKQFPVLAEKVESLNETIQDIRNEQTRVKTELAHVVPLHRGTIGL